MLRYQQESHQFNAEKVETGITYLIYVSPPKFVQNNANVTLHVSLEKVSLTDISSGQDTFTVYWYDDPYTEKANIFKNLTAPGEYIFTKYYRDVTMADVEKQDLNKMPGFQLSWYYSGIDIEEVVPEHRYDDIYLNGRFARNRSNSPKYLCIKQPSF